MFDLYGSKINILVKIVHYQINCWSDECKFVKITHILKPNHGSDKLFDISNILLYIGCQLYDVYNNILKSPGNGRRIIKKKSVVVTLRRDISLGTNIISWHFPINWGITYTYKYIYLYIYCMKLYYYYWPFIENRKRPIKGVHVFWSRLRFPPVTGRNCSVCTVDWRFYESLSNLQRWRKNNNKYVKTSIKITWSKIIKIFRWPSELITVQI